MSNITTQDDLVRAEQIARTWLNGAYLVGFCFDQIFTVTFNQKRRPVFEGHSLPWSSELILMEDWWLGDRLEWKRKIKEMGIGVEPSEPVKAFELAALRWSGALKLRK